MSRKEREMLARKNDIIRAAHDLFLEKKFDEVSMEEIARKAEFTRRTLYSYFNGKNDLIVEVLIEAYSKVEKPYLDAVESAENGYQALMGIASVYYNFFSETPAYYLLTQQYDLAVHNESDNLSETVINDLKASSFSLDSLALSVIRKGQEKGVFRSDIIPELATTYFFKSLFGIVHQYVLHSQFPPEYYYYEVKYLLRGITHKPERFEE